ncbi:unnamed protein product [Clonostachys byssicola]|uniref:Zn(2)-C6 fungal-type domain-containing protein n=1 Tax=Clonostachys byssicola TaxID=160290 RepID=A0A9N9XYB8_9HYPO|nr:unnamed protein product [Clonostachys byssicola]
MARHKERVRVSRACDFCKKKKIRCSGTQPCDLCTKDSLTCTFNAPYSRGKRRTTSAAAAIRPLTGAASSDRTGTSASLDGSLPESIPDDNSHGIDVNESGLSDQPIPSLFASPEIGASDRQGHFLNESSGLSFLLRLQRRLKGDNNSASPTSLFTLGDPALPRFNSAAFTLPTRQEADALVSIYFELSSAGYRFLHRPTVELWVSQIYEHGQILGAHWQSKFAVVLSMFAQASRYPDSHVAAGPNLGLAYFQAAEHQLALETEPASLFSAQALLGCCFYVLTRSRLNHCWSLFGTTSRLMLALGFHRRDLKLGQGPGAQVDHLEYESRKRLFWCAYNLDKTLSTILGRPCALHDCDIDQDLPNVVDDQDLSSTSIVVADNDNMHVMLGTIHNQKLGRILSKVLSSLYGLAPLSQERRYRIMKELGADVDAWRQSLPAFLNAERVDSRLLKPLFQRQSNILSLAAGHAEILIYRPCLFSDYTRHHHISEESTDSTVSNVQICLRAAMEIVRVVERMAEADQLYAASWVAQYQAFCAAVVLYTFTLKSTREDAATWGKYFRAAERCQDLLAGINNETSLARRLMMIMEEYRAEVTQKLAQDSPAAVGFPRHSGTFTGPMSGNGVANMSSQQDPVAEYSDIPNWEQLDYLALDLGDMIPDMDLIYTDIPYLGS